MIELKVMFSSIDEAVAFLSGQRAATAPAVMEVKAAAVAPVKETATPAPKSAKTEAPAPTPPSVALEPTPAAAPAASALTYEKDVAPKIALLVTKEGGSQKAEKTKALLAEFKVKRGPDLTAEQYAPFIAKIDALLAEEPSLA